MQRSSVPERLVDRVVGPTRFAGSVTVARECRLWFAMGDPQMRGALMSAKNDIEVAEPTLGELRERVELMRTTTVSSGQVGPLFDTGLRSTGWVA
jgi:hypothetical protein